MIGTPVRFAIMYILSYLVNSRVFYELGLELGLTDRNCYRFKDFIALQTNKVFLIIYKCKTLLSHYLNHRGNILG